MIVIKPSSLLLGVLGIFSYLAHAQDYHYSQCFEELRDEFVLPMEVLGEEQCRVGGVFGPYISACVNPGKYGFARSMSLKGTKYGEKVSAVLDGRVVYIGNFLKDDDHLHTIIIEHGLEEGCDYEGQPVSSFFTVYGHLAKDYENTPKINDDVSAGDIIGELGKCNACPTASPNLIFQVRLDVDWCPDLDDYCPSDSFGVPVHPYLTRPAFNKTLDYQLERVEDSETNNLTVSVSVPCNETDIVQYYVECGRQQGEEFKIDKTHFLQLNSREGFDPIPGLYAQDYSVPYLQPEKKPFSPKSAARWTTNIVIPSAWYDLTGPDYCCDIEVEDFNGNEVSEDFCGPNQAQASRRLRVKSS